jgi:hypothetical protein
MAKKKAKKKLEQIGSVSKTRQLQLLRDLNKVIKRHALSGTVAELHIKSMAIGGECPPGQALREVCKKLPDGTVVCEMKCMPL